MDVQYINPFVLASYTVMEMVLGQCPVRGNVAVQQSTFPCEVCNVICGVTGSVHGQVIYGMSEEVASQIASTMLGQPIENFDDMAISALAELGNMISGSAMQHLSESGSVCDITPPTIISGSDICFHSLAIPSVVIPLTTGQGPMTITVGLQTRN